MKTLDGLMGILGEFKVPLSMAGEVVDLLQFAIIEAFGDTHLPFLYEAIGPEKFLQVLDIFQDSKMIPCPNCGESINWPSRDLLAQTLRDLIIYFRLSRAHQGRKNVIIEETASEFGMTISQVRYADRIMRRKVANLLQTRTKGLT